MTRQQVIKQLLKTDTRYPKNILLLKKIIYTAYLCRLDINSLLPDKSIPLGEYLFDHERLIFDYTRLNDDKRAQFEQWLLSEHENEKENAFLTRVAVNEYRGFTAEVSLSWWGRLKSWLLNRYVDFWKIADLSLSLDYQLTGIEICHGQQGLLIGFNQFLVASPYNKYKAADDPQKEPLGNTKRVYLTDTLVEKLLQKDLNKENFNKICNQPHPLAVEVTSDETRFQMMKDYRTMQRFVLLKPWYIRLLHWVFSGFSAKKTKPVAPKKDQVQDDLTLLYENETTEIYQRKLSKSLVVKEKRPDIESLVLCGGGAKIFAHVGVWRALNEMHIHPVRFAGSSAGAIMALLCYLNYDAEEISALFKPFRQEHLVRFNIDRHGLSDSNSLKTALDFIIADKIDKIVKQYKISYPKGPITFATLDTLRSTCPGCGIGKELIVTATNKKLRKTTYFSLSKTPSMELSEAVKISASFPVLYRNTLIEGEPHNDGGILNNFPTDPFYDDNSTFLESEDGNDLKLLAVQFDNGTERNTIDRIRKRVYRENFILNWIFSKLTGVEDPVSGWEQDRMKLRRYATQSIIVDVGNISSTGFSVQEDKKKELIASGFQATMAYFKTRYRAEKEGASFTNRELMHATFANFDELLAYCCYRGKKEWFTRTKDLIEKSSSLRKKALIKHAGTLEKIYFTTDSAPTRLKENALTVNQGAFFDQKLASGVDSTEKRMFRCFLACFPIFLRLTPFFLKNKKDIVHLHSAHHSFSQRNLFKCLDYFQKIQDQSHIILHIFINLLKELFSNPDNDEIFKALITLRQVLDTAPGLYNNKQLFADQYYGLWDLTFSQSIRVLNLLQNQEKLNADFLACLRQRNEPLQYIDEKQRFCDDFPVEDLDYRMETSF